MPFNTTAAQDRPQLLAAVEHLHQAAAALTALDQPGIARHVGQALDLALEAYLHAAGVRQAQLPGTVNAVFDRLDQGDTVTEALLSALGPRYEASAPISRTNSLREGDRVTEPGKPAWEAHSPDDDSLKRGQDIRRPHSALPAGSTVERVVPRRGVR